MENEWEPVEVVKETVGYSVGIYLEDLAYGGAEEGGWYYNTGELQNSFAKYFRYILDKDETYRYCRFLNNMLDAEFNKDRREISSVLSEGRFRAIVFEGFNLPEYYPERKPHYE